jgi:hypothetical protein
MNNEHIFLITYGLHSFVSHAPAGENGVFTICARSGRKMIRHAVDLIRGSYGPDAAIQVA